VKGTPGKLLLLLLGLAVGTYFVLQRPGERSRTGAPDATLLSYDSAAVDRIEIISPEFRIVLAKETGGWQMTEPLRAPADEAAVASAIGIGRSIPAGAPVSTNPTKRHLFKVDSTGTVVRYFAGGTPAGSLVVGKPGPSFMDTYVRTEGSDDVLLAQGALGTTLARPVRDWRDKRVVAISKDAVRSVGYRYGDTTFTLALRDTVWTVGSLAADQSAAASLIGQLSALQADGFVDTAVTDPGPPLAGIEVEGTRIEVYRGGDGMKYLVKTSRSPQWFEVQKWRMDPLLKREREMLPPGS
jgi:hypothetical protein